MVAKSSGGREVGRPRTFQDAAIFLATARTLGRLGGRRLTFEAVAREVGCTKQAQVRRFGSKRGLLRAYLEWDNGVVGERFRAVRQAHASPLAALRVCFTLPAEECPDEVIDAAGSGNVLVCFIEAGSDLELRAVVTGHVGVFETEIASLPAATRGVVRLPRRWVVERSFAWAARFRRLAQDDARLSETVIGLHVVAFSCLMLHRAMVVLHASP